MIFGFEEGLKKKQNRIYMEMNGRSNFENKGRKTTLLTSVKQTTNKCKGLTNNLTPCLTWKKPLSKESNDAPLRHSHPTYDKCYYIYKARNNKKSSLFQNYFGIEK